MFSSDAAGWGLVEVMASERSTLMLNLRLLMDVSLNSVVGLCCEKVGWFGLKHPR